MKKTMFYLLNFTWGLPLNLLGLIVAVVLLCTGHKPKKWGACIYFEVGEGWGGIELGIIFVTNKNPSDHVRNHEHGHAIQNCYFGFLMPFIVCIPSVVRYWYRRLRTFRKLPNKTAYDDIWFEGQATRLGTKYVNSLK